MSINNGAANASNSSALSVAAVAVRVPPFWRRNPEAWFWQLEAQFALTGITANATRFNHAFVGVNKKSIGLVADVVEECSYLKLKNTLVKRLSVSKSRADSS